MASSKAPMVAEMLPPDLGVGFMGLFSVRKHVTHALFWGDNTWVPGPLPCYLHSLTSCCSLYIQVYSSFLHSPTSHPLIIVLLLEERASLTNWGSFHVVPQISLFWPLTTPYPPCSVAHKSCPTYLGTEVGRQWSKTLVKTNTKQKPSKKTWKTDPPL